MADFLQGKSIKEDFEAQVTAALMVQSNALIPIKLAVKLCGISRQEINRRIARGTFPKPQNTPLLNAYESLSQEHFKDYKKAVILITDGQIPSDEGLRAKLLSAKQDVLTFVYFLGEKNDQQLIGLANAFLAPSSDIKASLDQCFHSLGSAYNFQKVLKVK